MNALDSTSTRPYLIRALYEWCSDNGLTPYVAVAVDDSVQVPREYVKNHEIVLNISFDATSSLKLGNDFIEFKARFAGTARDIMVPIGRVMAIYARENGQGMAFPMPTGVSSGGQTTPSPITATQDNLPSSATTTSAVSLVAQSAPATVTADSKIVQLVSADKNVDAAHEETEPPEPPKPKQGTRPSLKRIK